MILPDRSSLALQPAPHWRQYATRHACGLPTELVSWLLDTGSLTRRLRQDCPGCFQVRVLWQGWSRPSRDEAQTLQLRPHARVWTREVQLLCGGQARVFARTLVPAATLRGRGRHLTRLGSRPLGEVLFTDPGVNRGPLRIARLSAGQALYQRACAGLTTVPDRLWGRRSIFRIDGCPLLVCEIFLPVPAPSTAAVDRLGVPDDEHRPL
jgi:chorismate--pyruvate lyase